MGLPGNVTGGPGTMGQLIARYRIGAALEKKSSGELAAGSGAWTVTPAGARAGFAALAGTSRLAAPAGRPAAWIGLEFVGEDGYSSTVAPWFGEVHNAARGRGGLVVAFAEDERLLVRTVLSASPRELRLGFADTAISAGRHLEVFAVR